MSRDIRTENDNGKELELSFGNGVAMDIRMRMRIGNVGNENGKAMGIDCMKVGRSWNSFRVISTSHVVVIAV